MLSMSSGDGPDEDPCLAAELEQLRSVLGETYVAEHAEPPEVRAWPSMVRLQPFGSTLNQVVCP